MTHLFEPLSLREVTFSNRIAVTPMCQYSSQDGYANDWHLVHLTSRAVGGAALVFTEAAAIEPQGRISPDDLGIWCDEHACALARIVALIHNFGSVAVASVSSTRSPQPSTAVAPDFIDTPTAKARGILGSQTRR